VKRRHHGLAGGAGLADVGIAALGRTGWRAVEPEGTKGAGLEVAGGAQRFFEDGGCRNRAV
jgi:hypothetical protein